MKVTTLLGALEESQNYIIKTRDGENIDVKTAAEHDAKVLAITAVKENLIRIDTNFSWYM